MEYKFVSVPLIPIDNKTEDWKGFPEHTKCLSRELANYIIDMLKSIFINNDFPTRLLIA